MFDKLSVTPSTIEGVAEMKEYVSTLQGNKKVEKIKSKIDKNVKKNR